jgi:hypothetical protein
VAQFGYADPELAAVACVTDFQTEPESDILERLLEYGIRVRREARADHQGRARKFEVVAALSNLTGNPQSATWDMHPPGFSGAGQSFTVILRTLSAEDAAETLDGIEAGRIARCLLPWIPLMTGGNDSRIIERWKQIAAVEPEAHRRADYAGLALVFSELSGGREVWKRALEGWNMRQSQQVLEWQAEAAAEAAAEARKEERLGALLDVVWLQFGASVPDELIAQMKGLTDYTDISRWFEAAVTSRTLEQFQSRVNGRS